jgi:hypothetical protein
MKELENGMQKLKTAIELMDPYDQIEAIGQLGANLIFLTNELGHNFIKCVDNYLDDLK